MEHPFCPSENVKHGVARSKGMCPPVLGQAVDVIDAQQNRARLATVELPQTIRPACPDYLSISTSEDLRFGPIVGQYCTQRIGRPLLIMRELSLRISVTHPRARGEQIDVDVAQVVDRQGAREPVVSRQ